MLIIDQICLVIPDPCHSLQFCQKVSAADPLSSVLDDILSLDKILSTDGGVLIIDQICLVIPDPHWFPDGGGQSDEARR